MWDENKYFVSGINFIKSSNYFEAFKSFDKAREENQEVPEYWHCAGHMLVLTDNKEKAKEYLKKAIELYDEEDHEGCFWIGAAYSLIKDKENALKYLKKAIQLDYFSNQYREDARKEEDYTVFYDDPDFRALTRNRTSEESHKEFNDFYIKKMKDENILFNQIDVSDFDLYLLEPFAVPFYGELFIKKDEVNNVGPFIDNYSLKPVKDHEGNITDIKAPSDMWQIEIFEGLAGFIREGSYILFIDDMEKFWKVEFVNKQVKYFRQN